MRKHNIEPKSYEESVLIRHSRNLGESDEEIAERLRIYRFVRLVTGIIAGISLVGVLCLYAFIIYQLLFVG
mgnify:FL=1|nr:MAG TPA: hypothetical protein [Bacteriophage sp.]